MITLTREEAQQIVDALKETWYHVGTFAPTEHAVDLYDKAIKTLRAKLSEPEPEPVAWLGISETWGLPKMMLSEYKKDGYKPVYLAPSQREWVGLMGDAWEKTNWSESFRAGAKWAEAYLKEKNDC